MKINSDALRWYQSRDDRTLRVPGIRINDDYSVGVIIDKNIVSSIPIQVMSLIALNLMSRWCKEVVIEMPDNVDSILSTTRNHNLNKILLETMKDANPFGKYYFDHVEEQQFNKILIIGHCDRNLKREQVRIYGWGWIGGIDMGIPKRRRMSIDPNNANPIGPTFAACLGNAELMSDMNKIPARKSACFSLFNFEKSDNYKSLINPDYDPEIDFGRIFQIGCGAVGSSLDYLLTLTKWKGDIDLIDFDSVSETDCNRSLVFTHDHSVKSVPKIQSCRVALASSNFKTKIFQEDYSSFIQKRGIVASPPDIILCFANDRNIWSTIQNNLPPIVFHATTTINWGCNFGRHIPMKEWCIMCRFSSELKGAHVPPCSEGKIPSALSDPKQSEQPLGVLPFLSTLSAVLILAEMAKMSLSNYPINENFVIFSSKGDGNFSKLLRKPKTDCICRSQLPETYPSSIKYTKFWNLVDKDLN